MVQMALDGASEIIVYNRSKKMNLLKLLIIQSKKQIVKLNLNY